MIGSIKGHIIHKGDRYILVENAGIGYKIFVNNDLLTQLILGGEVHLFIHTHVREDALDLYGFADMGSLGLFELLISVSGIGPKGALGIMSVSSADTLKRAIKSGDTSYLTKVSGIGKKTAEKIALELRDKIAGEFASTGNELEVMEALQALGYRESDIRDILRQIDNTQDTNTQIKDALKLLSNK